MLLDDIRSIVGQNCPEFKANSTLAELSMSAAAGSCEHCKNYSKDDCSKGLFKEIMEKLTKN